MLERTDGMDPATELAQQGWNLAFPEAARGFAIELWRHASEASGKLYGPTPESLGLGRSERIYAVRFIGDVGYVVTFRQTDPLYTIDLSTPSRPRVLDALPPSIEQFLPSPQRMYSRVFSVPITLFLVPCLYLLADDFRRWGGGLCHLALARGRTSPHPQPAPTDQL